MFCQILFSFAGVATESAQRNLKYGRGRRQHYVSARAQGVQLRARTALCTVLGALSRRGGPRQYGEIRS